jgi:hypothetical protein
MCSPFYYNKLARKAWQRLLWREKESMNIVFENNRAENEGRNAAASAAYSNTNKAGIPHNSARAGTANGRGAFAWDAPGTVMDNTAYGNRGKSMEDIMMDAGQMDVAAQRNYMAVMSNTMSDEDLAKLQEEGYHPGSTEIGTVVTILDEIKAALVKGGKNIAGYTDDLDVETLAEITGSTAMAEEIVKQFASYDIPVTKENVEDVLQMCATAAKLSQPGEGTVKYMVQNHMEPTVDNVYKAQYSAAADASKQGRGYYQDDAGYYAKKAEEYNWQQLRPQMEKVIENAGLEISEETLADAKWLLEKGMPLAEEGLNTLYDIRNMEIPDTMEKMVSSAAAAIADGKNTGAANLSDGRTAVEKAAAYMEDVNSISDEAVDMVAGEGKKLNLRNLKAAQIQISLNISVRSYSVSLNGRRLMEEVRLQMTVEANIHLIKSGFSVDTAELEQLVESLKAAQKQAEEALFGKTGEGAASILKNTMAAVKGLGGMPAALVGKFAFQGRVQLEVRTSASYSGNSGSFTLETAYREGAVLQAAYEKAGESYETLMTAPRADLGDSIKKAFRNVDDILKDMGMEASDYNRRAVRILGYNRMEISSENIEAVKTADTTIRRVLDKMTPAAVMQMIREGKNPLSMDMQELETYLNDRERSPQEEIEKYSEYLYKLERNHAVTEQERDAYIGIYRLFRQLEKTDGAAIGTLINQGAEPTVRNLLSAMRSNKKHGMDMKVDDHFGGITSSYTGKSISEQIESGYYKKLASDIFDYLDGGKMNVVPSGGDIGLEEMAEALRNAEPDEMANREYRKEQAGEIRKAMTAEDTVIKELLNFEQPVTADHLMAAGLVAKERGKAAGRFYELAEETGNRAELDEAVENLYESMTDEEPMKEAYERLGRTYADILERAVYGEDSTGKIDLKEIGSLYKQVAFNAGMAKEESYEVPVRIDGEMTSINLKIVHGREESGKVMLSMETTIYGKVAAQFGISAGRSGEYHLSGYVSCGSRDGLERLENMGEELKKVLEQSDIKIINLSFVYNSGLDLSAVSRAAVQAREEAAGRDRKQEVSTKKLYDTAKIFIGYIKKGEGTGYENKL